jgi:hypothetical protein
METDLKRKKNHEIYNHGITLEEVTFFVNNNQKVYDANLEQNHP